MVTTVPFGALGVPRVQESHSWSPCPMPGANPSWHGPGSQRGVETSERKQRMGMFCQGNKENKRPATENSMGKCAPSTGGHRHLGSLLTFRAQAWSPPRARRHGPPAVPGITVPAAVPACRGIGVRQEEPRNVDTCSSGAETQQDGNRESPQLPAPPHSCPPPTAAQPKCRQTNTCWTPGRSLSHRAAPPRYPKAAFAFDLQIPGL